MRLLMIKEIKDHLFAYLLLVGLLVGYAYAFISFWSDRLLLKGVVVMMIITYFLWGVLVHKKSGQINVEIVKEYGLIALVGGVVLLMLTY